MFHCLHCRPMSCTGISPSPPIHALRLFSWPIKPLRITRHCLWGGAQTWTTSASRRPFNARSLWKDHLPFSGQVSAHVGVSVFGRGGHDIIHLNNLNPSPHTTHHTLHEASAHMHGDHHVELADGGTTTLPITGEGVERVFAASIFIFFSVIHHCRRQRHQQHYLYLFISALIRGYLG